jgi:hypothetical protein
MAITPTSQGKNGAHLSPPQAEYYLPLCLPVLGGHWLYLCMFVVILLLWTENILLSEYLLSVTIFFLFYTVSLKMDEVASPTSIY